MNKARQRRTSVSAKGNINLRLAGTDDARDSRVHRLVDLASELMREAQVLARDKAFAAESVVRATNMEGGVDFYSEVKQFETALIKLALGETDGNQSRAAKLLGLQATTLNSKIKLYKIEY
jgi:DNA-binding protein Fis